MYKKTNPDIFVVDKMNGADPDEESQKKIVSIDDALTIIGFGKVQIIAILLCGTILMAVIIETMGMSIIMPASQCDLKLTTSDKGIASAISFIGIMMSSHLWGYLADTAGRRKVIIYTVFASNICTVASSFSTNFTMFIVLRFFVGFFVSGPSATIYAYLGEFNTPKYRSVAIAWASSFVGISNLLLPALGWLILSSDWSVYISEYISYRPWRLLMIIYTLPGCLGAIGIIFMPESAKYVLGQGRSEEALEIIQRVFKMNNPKKSLDDFPVKGLLPETEIQIISVREKGFAKIVESIWNQTAPLFKRPYGFNFLTCGLLQFGVFLASGGMGLWYADIQNRLAANAGKDYTICQMLDMPKVVANESQIISFGECNDTISEQTFIDTLVLGTFYISGYIALGFLIKALGQKNLLTASLFISGIAGLLLHWISEGLAIVFLFSSYLMFSGICVSVVNSVVVDLIPTQLRGMAVSVSLIFGRLGSIVGSNVVGQLIEVNCDATFFFFSGWVLGCALITFLLPKKKKM